jgi:hypothetical protein
MRAGVQRDQPYEDAELACNSSRIAALREVGFSCVDRVPGLAASRRIWRPLNPRSWRSLAWNAALLAAASALAAVASCREPARKPTPVETNSNAHVVVAPKEADQEPPSVPVRVGSDDSARWLVVTRIDRETEGGWATGSFDPQRNKITVHTRNVQRFTIDVGRIPVDWERLVVLSIDERNSELRRRDFDLLEFVRTQRGGWTIVEPDTEMNP